MAYHKDVEIEWFDDKLPSLTLVMPSARTFDLILLSGVWMHLDEEQRAEGMLNLSRLTHSGSQIVMSLRHGPVPVGRVMFEVSEHETTQLAREYGFSTLFSETSESIQEQNRKQGVWWTKLVFRKD